MPRYVPFVTPLIFRVIRSRILKLRARFCKHRHTILTTTGGRHFYGEVWDNIIQQVICTDCLTIIPPNNPLNPTRATAALPAPWLDCGDPVGMQCLYLPPTCSRPASGSCEGRAENESAGG